MNLEIATHCWHYSRPLIFQFSSLFLYPPHRLSVTMTLFFTETDSRTVEVLRFFATQAAPANVNLRPWVLPADLVTRRMIGRNLAALATKGDWIWFADCDYVFREGCLDSLASLVLANETPLFFPRHVQISNSHSAGDRELQRVCSEVSLADITPQDYVQQTYNRAIGGIQIARAEVAREKGYCRDSRYHQCPSSEWVPTRDDVWFRRSLGTQGTPIEIPNLYRIRHSVRGGAIVDGTLPITSE